MVRYIHTEIAAPKCWGPPPAMTSNTMAKRMINASICAYSVNSPTRFYPACQYWDAVQATGTVDLITAYAPHGTAPVDAAFIAKTTDNWAVLSLRGTEPPSTVDSIATFKRFVDDWYQDSKSKRVAMMGPNGNGLGSVHKGFHDAFVAMLPHIHSVLSGMDWSALKGLQITGHSKGASLTFLFAIWLKQCFPQIKTIEVNAFAPTSVGDYTFASLYNAAKIPTVRHVRDPDCVPYLLPFYSVTPVNTLNHPSYYDIYNYLTWSAVNLTEEAFHEIGKLVEGGYYGMGDVIYYPGAANSHATPITGLDAQNAGFWNLLKVIKRHWGIGDLGEIAGAHSATKSYHPAVMNA